MLGVVRRAGAPRDRCEVAEVIKRHTAKLSINDNERVAAAIDHYEPHIDFDKLLE